MIYKFLDEYKNKSKLNRIKKKLIFAFSIITIVYLAIFIYQYFFNNKFFILTIILYFLCIIVLTSCLFNKQDKGKVYYKEKELVIQLLKKYQLSIKKENIDILKETCSKEIKNIKLNKIDTLLSLLALAISFINSFISKNNQFAISLIALVIFFICIIFKNFISLVDDSNYDILEDILNELLLEQNIKKERSFFQRLIKIFIS